jgi:hypothetical protein
VPGAGVGVEVRVLGAGVHRSFVQERLESRSPVRRKRVQIIGAELIKNDNDDEAGWLLGARRSGEQQDRREGGQQSEHAGMLAGRCDESVTDSQA